MAMGRDRWQAKTWAEYDVVTAWRHYLCYMKRGSGTIKRLARRRERRAARQQLRSDDA